MSQPTPWGETWDHLADAALADSSAPPRLALAAFLFKQGAEGELRGLVADAVALNDSEASGASPTLSA